LIGTCGAMALSSLATTRKRVEMLFAHLDRILRLGRLRLRGRIDAHKNKKPAKFRNLLHRRQRRPSSSDLECEREDSGRSVSLCGT
jgi:hypothetical protein